MAHSVEWLEWWDRLSAWWPVSRRITKAEEREWFLSVDEPGEIEELSLGLG